MDYRDVCTRLECRIFYGTFIRFPNDGNLLCGPSGQLSGERGRHGGGSNEVQERGKGDVDHCPYPHTIHVAYRLSFGHPGLDDQDTAPLNNVPDHRALTIRDLYFRGNLSYVVGSIMAEICGDGIRF